MTLYIVGLGIYESPSLPGDVIRKLNKMDRIFIETYTSPIKIDDKMIMDELGVREIIHLKREDLEDGYKKIINMAMNEDIAILVPGDPLIATTHVTLLIEARKAGVNVKVIHSSSALCTAIGESGLHTYKFGPSSTTVRKDVASSRRAYDILKDNLSKGLHTLFFLEYDHESDYIMKPDEAIEILLYYDEKEILKNEQPVIVLCGLGRKDEIKRVYTIKEILNKEFPKTPCILIFPGKLHFMEMEYIDTVLREDDQDKP